MDAHRELSVDHHSKVANDGHWLDIDGANMNGATGMWDLAELGGRSKPHHLCLISIQLKTLSSAPGNDFLLSTYNAQPVEKKSHLRCGSHQIERRQLCLVFIDQIKQVRFKVSSF